MTVLTEQLISSIYELHSEGFFNREIARKLLIHHKTVSSYLKVKNLSPNRPGPKTAQYTTLNKIICSKCFVEQFEDNFLLCRRNKPYPYRLSYCNNCRRNQLLQNTNSDIFKVLRDIFLRTKQRCSAKGIKFNITFEYLKDIYNKQNGLCFYSNLKLELIRGKGANWNSCTLDKVIPNRGYVPGNIVLCTRRFNTVKNDLSLLEIKEHMPSWHDKLLSTNWLSLT